MENHRSFILCRDRSEARRIRRIIATSDSGFNVQVGTWLELIQAALDAYLLSEPECHWNDSLSQTLEQLPNSFWSKSHTVATDETTAVISRELDKLIRSLPPATELTHLSNTYLSERAQQHLADLSHLHKAMGSLLPADLEATTRILNTPAESALRFLNVSVIEGSAFLNPWQKALIVKLNHDSSPYNSDAVDQLLQVNLRFQTSDESVSLNVLQHGLYQENTSSATLDKSLQWLAARDYLEEVEVVAGMIQKSLTENETTALSDIALLLPSDSTYSAAVKEVFQHAGLPVSGLVVKQQNRDLGHEVVFHLLQTLRKPAPTMAMAAFVTSPLLPWTRAQGFDLATALMGGNYSLEKIELPTQASNDILNLIRYGVDTVAALKKILKSFPSLLNNTKELEGQRAKATALCEVLQKQLEGTDIPWDVILTMAAPYPDTIDIAGDITREGIAVFYEHEEPWRLVKTLYVLGFNDGHYPAEARTSPVFSDADITILRSQGFELERSVDVGDRLRALFCRQLRAAKENIHFLLSRRDSYGKHLSPSASLPFMAQLFDIGEEPEALILELDTEEGRNKARGLALASDTDPAPPRELEIKDLRLENNLLEILKNKDGTTRPQSPSSLETLMTSPLAWLLNRSGLEPSEWQPEKLDVMSKGTLAHAVFEKLFVPGQPIPSEDEVKQRVPSLLIELIIAMMPFLNRPEWRVERFHLEKEILTAAGRWREVLDAIGAKVLGVEVWLKGFLNQHPIHGSADLLLELPDGKIYVVDYKKSSSKKRKERMRKGFDSQASLYRIMLHTGEGKFRSSDDSTVMIDADREIGALYYLMNDQVALADTDGWIADSLRDFEELGADVSANALPLIRDRLSQVKMGHVMLNKYTDESWFEKNAGVPLYALNNSPLIRMFMHQDQEQGE